MATDTSLLEGEVVENPVEQEVNVEKMLFGFMRSLLAEQQGQSS